jgi:exopolysaccharide transport family protein
MLRVVQGKTDSASSSIASQESEFDLLDLLRILRRRKWFIIIPAAIVTALAVIATTQLQNVYTASADVRIGAQPERIANMQAVLTETPPDKQAVQSEIEVMLSKQLAQQVVDKLHLTEDPDFNPSLLPPTPLGVYWDAIKRMFDRGQEEPVAAADPENQEKSKVVEGFRKRSDASQKGDSWVIALRFTAEDPAKAAQIVNALADAYILDQLEAKFAATQRATGWLNDKIADLREKVAQSERAVEAFRSEAGLLKGKEGTLIAQQVSELNTQLLLAKAKRAEADARLHEVNALVRSPLGAASANEALQSSLIANLTTQEAEVKRQVAELSEVYGDQHPKLIAGRAQLQDIQSKIGAEVNKIAKGLESEAKIAEQRVSMLEQSLERLEGELSRSNTADVRLRSLEREAQASRTMLEAFLSRAQETSLQTDLAVIRPDARVISKANPPEQPSFPPKRLIVFASLAGTAFFASILAIALDQMDRGFRSGDQIEKLTGVRSLGSVPLFGKWNARQRRSLQDYIIRHPSSMAGEALRSLHTSILIGGPGSPPRKILVTSCLPKEGKTTISTSMGRLRASSSHSVILVEADLRQSTFHKIFGMPRRPGVCEIVKGEASLSDEAFYRDATSGAFVLPAGYAPTDPTEIFSSPRFAALLNSLAKKFELVIIDAPPVIVSEPRLLVPLVDMTLLVVRWGRTSREAVDVALKRLLEAGADGKLGTVLSMVDSKKQTSYGYGDAMYYHRSTKKYYTP